MTPREIFEAYIGMDCFTFLYNYHMKDIEKAIRKEPVIYEYETIEVEGHEKQLKEIDAIVDYEDSFGDLANAAQENIYSLCQIATMSYFLVDLLEDMIKHALSNKLYSIGHNILEYLDNDLTEAELKNLNQLAINDKQTFEGIIGYTKT
jgi:hypothetical protein